MVVVAVPWSAVPRAVPRSVPRAVGQGVATGVALAELAADAGSGSAAAPAAARRGHCTAAPAVASVAVAASAAAAGVAVAAVAGATGAGNSHGAPCSPSGAALELGPDETAQIGNWRVPLGDFAGAIREPRREPCWDPRRLAVGRLGLLDEPLVGSIVSHALGRVAAEK